ncbi:thioesterase family protein [Sandaracinobacteroides hominis]|uniref:thioesterase family protein n=1 Tax=Sandaracinobacteroides hominis TaxID=2780086 RepID=UPI0018F28450|nr:thioesterase family protein [Sandaracinobacteroides hominis]
MDFDSVLAGMVAVDGGWTATVPEDWQQGRTAFGGLSAALALSACRKLVPDLPVLRSGQIAYIGPAIGELTMRPTVLRRGKSVTFMGCDLMSGGAVALRALYAFGDARPSTLSAVAEGPPDCPAPDDCAPMWGDSAMRPGFARHLDQRPAGKLMPFSGADTGDLLVWVRHRDPVEPSIEALVAMGDALPPASFTRMRQLTVISTVTWSFDLFDPHPEDGAGWLLMRSTDDGVGDGYAGQDMAMWSESGRPILKARQSVAIFG